MSVSVTDLTGTLVESRANIPANQSLKLGSKLKAGTYIVTVTQGTESKQMKVIKHD